MTEKTRAIIEKWYKKLGFDAEFDDEFYKALDEVDIPEGLSIADYDGRGEDGRYNLLSYLYMCEDVSRIYAEMGIGEDILIDTLYDVVLWTRTWSGIKGGLYLGELGWLSNHVRLRLHKLGRLQFCRGRCEMDIPDLGIKAGDPILEIHIPRRGPLTAEECQRSIAMAKEFYAKYYPDYDYKCFTCASWLMDDTLRDLLPAESNIVKFRNMFTVIYHREADSVLKYVFGWDKRREYAKTAEATTSFAKALQAHVLADKPLYSGFGYIEK